MRSFPVQFRGLLALLLFVSMPGARPAVAQQPDVGTMPGIELVGGLVVKWRDDPSGEKLAARIASFDRVAHQHGLQIAYVRAAALGRHVLKLDKASPLAEVQALGRAIMAGDKDVESIEPNVIMRAMPAPADGVNP